MKHLLSRLCPLVLLALASVPATAEALKDNVSLKINSKNGIYAKGDTVCVHADVKKIPEAELEFQISDFGDVKRCRERQSAGNPPSQGGNLVRDRPV